jgi:hypothetical protein
MTQEVSDKVASLEAIPRAVISDMARVSYIRRAQAGELVYAYPPAGPASERLWNVFDTETRIPYPALEKQWKIIFTIPNNCYAWTVVLTRGDEKREITLFIHARPSDKDRFQYLDRAERVIRSVVGHLASYDSDPDNYNKTHH